MEFCQLNHLTGKTWQVNPTHLRSSQVGNLTTGELARQSQHYHHHQQQEWGKP